MAHRSACRFLRDLAMDRLPLCTKDQPFDAIAEGTWLHHRSKEEAYVPLVDCFRLMRQEAPELHWPTDCPPQGGGEYEQEPDSKRFLGAVEARARQDPYYWPWDQDRARACLSLGRRGGPNGHFRIDHATSREEVALRYQDATMPEQMLAFCIHVRHGEVVDDASVGSCSQGERLSGGIYEAEYCDPRWRWQWQ